MQAIEMEVDINDNGEVINARLPASCKHWFGNHAKLMVILPDEGKSEKMRQDKMTRWRTLLKETQALPQAHTITEAEIQAEIEAYRNGQ